MAMTCSHRSLRARSSRHLAGGLLVACIAGGLGVTAAAAGAAGLHRIGHFTSHVSGYPAAGAPAYAQLSSVSVDDDVSADRTTFTVTLAAAPPSDEESHRLTVGIGNYNVYGECVLASASAQSMTWLEQPVRDDYIGYAFSRSGNVITAEVYQGTVNPHTPTDEGYDCGGAVLDYHADDGTPYNWESMVTSTDRMLGRLTAPRSRPVLKSGKLNAHGGKVRVKVRCASAVDCRGKLSIKSGKTRVGNASYTVLAGKTKRTTVKLTKSAKRLLARHTRIKVAVVLKATDGTRVSRKTRLAR